MARRPQFPVVPIALALAALAAGSLLFTTGRYVMHHYQLRSEETQIRREIEELDRDRAQLEAVRDYLKSDEYLEYVSRRTLGLVKPGETLVIVSPSDVAALPTPTAPSHEPGVPWWKALFGSPPPATTTPTPAD